MLGIFLFFMLIPFTAHAATCDPGYYLKNGECLVCNPNGTNYYCPGDDTHHQCPTTDTDYNQFGYEMIHGKENAFGYTKAKAPTDCLGALYFRDEYDNNFLVQSPFNGENYWGTSNWLWYGAGPGYYLSGYSWTSLNDWYNGVKACTNAPEHAHYTGAGTPDAPDGSIIDANDCPWACDDEYMLHAATGTCVVKCTPGYALNSVTGQCDLCIGPTYSDAAGATECTPCPPALVFKDRVTGYWIPNGIHTSADECHANITTDDPHGNYRVACQRLNGDYGVYEGTDGNYCYAQPVSCIGGYSIRYTVNGLIWGPTVERLKDYVCRPVGPEYWSADGDLNRNACPTGQTTIGYGLGADEESDCGHALHVGDYTIHLRNEKRTSPAFVAEYGGQKFYGDMSPTPRGRLRTTVNNTVYSVHDDSM